MRIKKIMCFIFVIAGLLPCAVACSSSPKSLEHASRGERAAFTMNDLKKCEKGEEISSESGAESDTLMICVTTEGHSDVEYMNCSFTVSFSGLLVYADMTEEYVECSFVVALPFSGSTMVSYPIETDKIVHNIFEQSYEISDVKGEMIKK